MAEPIKLDKLPPELWKRVSDLFDEVLDLDESKRIDFIRKLWATEPLAASELVALLVAAVLTKPWSSVAVQANRPPG